MQESFQIHPIGFFHCQETYTYDVPRQGTLAGNQGVLQLNEGMNFQQALTELLTFDRIWVLFIFNKNNCWKPMVRPPRHREKKVGVFASRAPYRPNQIGMSCVKLIDIKGLNIYIAEHDLLDNTPVIDIKPYIPYADAFPNASPGWTAFDQNPTFSITFSSKAEAQIQWLEHNGIPCLRQFIFDRLEQEPLNSHRNRLLPDIDNAHVLAYRTWRILFTLHQNTITILQIRSAYSPDELLAPNDKYMDKSIHKRFSLLECEV